MHSQFGKLSRVGFAGLVAIICSNVGIALAGSATWQSNPATGDWNTAANWTPATVPNGLSDVATFAVSSQTQVNVSSSITLSGIVFQPNASAFTITTSSSFASILINGAGVTNNAAIAQNFIIGAVGRDQGELDFAGSATAGNAIYTESGSAVRNSFGGTTSFFNTSTAGTATFFLNGGAANSAAGGGVLFFDSSTAGQADFTLNAGTVSGATGGHVEFVNTSTAANATLTAKGGTNGAGGGTIFFFDDPSGGKANIVLNGNGTLDITGHNAPGITIASLRGDGLVSLGSRQLGVKNGFDNVFEGVISGSGTFVKAGQAKLQLTNANSYTGGTTVRAGLLLVDNTSGSGTGTGAVQVDSGALGGFGTISGAVTVGRNDPGNGAFLIPGQTVGHPGTLTILNGLTFASDGFYNVGLGRDSVASKVVANTVTIQEGAQFAFGNNRGFSVPDGTVLTVIDNTGATPIAGVFENLPEGFVFTDHGNRFEVTYQGGDGNDLTLTSIP